MERLPPLENELPSEQVTMGKLEAESKLRQFEQRDIAGGNGDIGGNDSGSGNSNKAGATDVPDHEFVDKTGHPITVRTFTGEKLTQVRAYDTDKVSVPENVDRGQAGSLNLYLEKGAFGSDTKVRIQDIEVPLSYQKQGIASEMLNQGEAYAKQQGATEMYGTIQDTDAKSFWEHMAKEGYTVQQSPNSFYGEVHKRL